MTTPISPEYERILDRITYITAHHGTNKKNGYAWLSLDVMFGDIIKTKWIRSKDSDFPQRLAEAQRLQADWLAYRTAQE